MIFDFVEQPACAAANPYGSPYAIVLAQDDGSANGAPMFTTCAQWGGLQNGGQPTWSAQVNASALLPGGQWQGGPVEVTANCFGFPSCDNGYNLCSSSATGCCTVTNSSGGTCAVPGSNGLSLGFTLGSNAVSVLSQYNASVSPPASASVWVPRAADALWRGFFTLPTLGWANTTLTAGCAWT